MLNLNAKETTILISCAITFTAFVTICFIWISYIPIQMILIVPIAKFGRLKSNFFALQINNKWPFSGRMGKEREKIFWEGKYVYVGDMEKEENIKRRKIFICRGEGKWGKYIDKEIVTITSPPQLCKLFKKTMQSGTKFALNGCDFILKLFKFYKLS